MLVVFGKGFHWNRNVILATVLSLIPAGTTKENLRWWVPALETSTAYFRYSIEGYRGRHYSITETGS